MDDSEREGLIWMIELAARYETIAWVLLDMEWIADEPSADELSTLGSFANLSQGGSDAAVEALDLPWVADGVSDTEARVIRALGRIANLNAAAAESFIALPWIADGVSDTEAGFISSLGIIANTSAAVAESVIALALPWVADDVSDTEADFIERLSYLAGWGAAVAESVIALPWVADGVSDSEVASTSALYYIALANIDAAARVADMPFLQTLEGADVAALDNLAVIAFNDQDQFADILARPILKDGITDDEAPIVSMLGWNQGVNDKLLDPDMRTVERRTVELPLAGEVDLVIVRTRPGARRSMDLLENAVREAENLMGEPLPTRYVGLLFEDVFGDGSSAAGINYGTHIALSHEHDSDDGRSFASVSPRFIAHEVAHYYWKNSAVWLDEGMAELMASTIENRRVGTPINVTNDSCEFARSIKEMEALPSEQRWTCSYPLGEGLFVSLLRALGEDAFWEGARSLYAEARSPVGVSQALWLDYMSRGLLDPAGVEEVRQAFGPDASDVIARWYEGN